MVEGSQRKIKVFLSYRREDCAMHAGRLADNLQDRGVADVFIDVDAILPGQNFVQRIDEEMAACDAVLVMIGDDWLTLTDAADRPRITNPQDWVYLEVKSALERDVPVIPILVEGMAMPVPADLPEPIQALAERMAVTMRKESWREDYEKLASSLPAAVQQSGHHINSGGQGETESRQERASVDYVAARAFVESVPAGRWASFRDVSLAGGSPSGARAVGRWLRSRGRDIPGAWRILTEQGLVSDGWSAEDDPDLPSNAYEVRRRLEAEGVAFDSHDAASPETRWSRDDAAEAGAAIKEIDWEPSAPTRRRSTSGDTLIVAGRRAYPDYLLSSSYICQQGRSFRNEVGRMGFYAERAIKPEIPQIIDRRDNVEISPEHAALLEARGRAFDVEYAALIRRCLDPTVRWATQRDIGAKYQFFLLTDPDTEETVVLDHPIWHDGKSAWVQAQRYADLSDLRAASDTTSL
ncbi:MAG: TIR domain-containing protein [Solirubrobacterales bacterium]